jgi:hypothetical protein
MKLATLLVPAYLPRSHPGATPTPYQSSTVDTFERGLVALSPLVIRRPNAVRITADPHGRFVHQQIVTEYEMMWDPATVELSKAVDMALKAFALSEVVVLCDGDAEPISANGVTELAEGLHPWCDEGGVA